MINTELLVIGGGPAGLCAAISAAEAGARVLILERSARLGGQLIKQTHMFFGSQKQYASTRGIDIASILQDKLNKFGDRISIMTDTTAVGIYEDGVVTAMHAEDDYFKIRPRAVIVATGASEKALAFENNDLPGIYGAGAVQTLMNVYGVKPGNRVLMVGAGNIGLIVSYQLMQAGVEVAAILDAAPRIGGYLVHAAKVRRMGVPILVSHTIREAVGTETFEKAVICKVDEAFNPIPGTESEIEADVCCISVGLTPLCELLAMAGCEMKYVPALGGNVPVRDENYRTSIENIFVAGDASGIEEASSAMVEGYIAGLCAAERTGNRHERFNELLADYRAQLASLRGGPAGKHILNGIAELMSREQSI